MATAGGFRHEADFLLLGQMLHFVQHDNPLMSRHRAPGFRTLCGTSDSGIDLAGKFEAEIRFVSLVPIDGPKELLFSRRVKMVVHPSNRFQTLAKTSFPEIGLTFPDRNSARRR